MRAKSIPSVGGLIEYLCSGVGKFAFFRQRDWDQVLACLHGVFDLFGKGMEFGVKCFTITLKGKFVCIVTFYTAMMM